LISTILYYKKYEIPVSLCFVIGLEGDSYEKTQKSIELARKLKPDHIYWNMITPFEGTYIKEWYEKNGKIFDLVNHSSWVDGDFMCEEPCVETPEFGIEERKKAYLMAILKTNDTRLKLSDINRLLPYVREYGLYTEFFYWIPQYVFTLISLALKLYPEIGLRGILKRSRSQLKNKPI
jgi:radical SAM superfamily enzyme YgiQ (UPF0313 family)